MVVRKTTGRSIMKKGAAALSGRRLMRPQLCPGVVPLIDEAGNTADQKSKVYTTVRDIAVLRAALMITPTCDAARRITLPPMYGKGIVTCQNSYSATRDSNRAPDGELGDSSPPHTPTAATIVAAARKPGVGKPAPGGATHLTSHLRDDVCTVA